MPHQPFLLSFLPHSLSNVPQQRICCQKATLSLPSSCPKCCPVWPFRLVSLFLIFAVTLPAPIFLNGPLITLTGVDSFLAYRQNSLLVTVPTSTQLTQPRVRIMFIWLTTLGPFFLVAYVENVGVKLLGVAISAASCGFGEITFFSLSSYYHKYVPCPLHFFFIYCGTTQYFVVIVTEQVFGQRNVTVKRGSIFPVLRWEICWSDDDKQTLTSTENPP